MSRIHHKLSPQFLMPWHPGLTVSTTRAAELLGCCTSTILSLIDEGALEAFKMRKHLPNSPYKVIYESVLRVADDWRRDAGVASPQGTASAAAAGAAPLKSTNRT